MSEWDKLWEKYAWVDDYEFGVWQLEDDVPIDCVLLKKIKVEGDLNLKEKRSLLVYAKMLRNENAFLEKKLDIIREFIKDAPLPPNEALNHILEMLS